MRFVSISSASACTLQTVPCIFTERSHRGIIHLEDQETIRNLGREVLGPRHLRTPTKPTKSDGNYEGGTAFERSDRAKPVKKGGRCYTNAYSFQVPNKVSSTTVGSKRTGEDKDNLQIRTDVNHVCFSCCIL